MLKTCLFIGPTGSSSELHDLVDSYPPACLGSVFRAVEKGYRQIGIVDAYFGHVATVWHKEILFALSRRALVWGAASAGALRAAELERFGMMGCGIVFRLFRRGILEDDDEVCVIHAPRELRYEPLSFAMVNIRYTLKILRRRGTLCREEERILCDQLKSLHFSSRDETNLYTIALSKFGNARGRKIADDFMLCYFDVKARDAEQLVHVMTRVESGSPSGDWKFPRTEYWVQQFEKQLSDVPPLGFDAEPSYTTSHKDISVG
ncbi:MAG TPA: TfuA-like protein [Xanthobacteraceae bacterium]